MPISEDELDGRIHSSSSSLSQSHHYHYSGLSKAEQRKNNKPIMEKRRRARINHCLNELKALILDATNKDPARHSKLEKADILEMTVKHLQSIQRQQLSMAVASDPTVLHKFKTGFSECASEVSRYIGHIEGVETDVKQRLISHLSSYATAINPPPGFSATSSDSFRLRSDSGRMQNPANLEDFNNNDDSETTAGLRVIPSRLPTGELALLLPNSSSLSSLFTSPTTVSITDRSHPSAFTAVSKEKNHRRPQSPSSSKSENLAEIVVAVKPPRFSPHSEVSSTSNDGVVRSAESTVQVSSSERKPQHSGIPLGLQLIEPTPIPDYSLLSSKNSGLLRPIDVYADPPANLKVPTPANSSASSSTDNCSKSPLDFSVRKDPQIPTVSRKRPLEDIPCNIAPRPPKMIKCDVLVKNAVEKSVQEEELSNTTIIKPNEKNSQHGRGDMWRPW